MTMHCWIFACAKFLPLTHMYIFYGLLSAVLELCVCEARFPSSQKLQDVAVAVADYMTPFLRCAFDNLPNGQIRTFLGMLALLRRMTCEANLPQGREKEEMAKRAHGEAI